MESAIVAIVGSIRCIYSMHWTEANTGIVTAHVCGEEDQTKLAPYRRGQGSAIAMSMGWPDGLLTPVSVRAVAEAPGTSPQVSPPGLSPQVSPQG